MKGEYDDLEDNDEFQHIGLGAEKRSKLSKNQQIYGDFYQAYEPEPQTNYQPASNKKSYGAYGRFKAGSII